MPEIINNGKELLRINRTKNIIEFSRTDGRSWVLCCNCGTMYRNFLCIVLGGMKYSPVPARDCIILEQMGAPGFCVVMVQTMVSF